MSSFQISDTDVIFGGRTFQNITGTAAGSEPSKFDSMQPNLVSVTNNVIDLNDPIMIASIGSDEQFTVINQEAGKTCMLLLDIGSGNEPTFPGDFKWADNITPPWTSWQYWQVIMQCTSPGLIRATAVGFESITGPLPYFPATFSPPAAWDTTVSVETANFIGANASCGVRVMISPDPTRNRVVLLFRHFEDAPAVQNYVYLPYSNLGNITKFEMKYEASVQRYRYGNLPQRDNFSVPTGPDPTNPLRNVPQGHPGENGYQPGVWYDITGYTPTVDSNGNVTAMSSYTAFCWSAIARVGNPGINVGDYSEDICVSFAGSTENLAVRITNDQGDTFVSTCDLGSELVLNNIIEATGGLYCEALTAQRANL